MDTLWAIADKMRFRKEQGEFKTYRDANRWAAIKYTLIKSSTFDISKA